MCYLDHNNTQSSHLFHISSFNLASNKKKMKPWCLSHARTKGEEEYVNEMGSFILFYVREGWFCHLAWISFGQIGDWPLFVQVAIGDPILSKWNSSGILLSFSQENWSRPANMRKFNRKLLFSPIIWNSNYCQFPYFNIRVMTLFRHSTNYFRSLGTLN